MSKEEFKKGLDRGLKGESGSHGWIESMNYGMPYTGKPDPDRDRGYEAGNRFREEREKEKSLESSESSSGSYSGGSSYSCNSSFDSFMDVIGGIFLVLVGIGLLILAIFFVRWVIDFDKQVERESLMRQEARRIEQIRNTNYSDKQKQEIAKQFIEQFVPRIIYLRELGYVQEMLDLHKELMNLLNLYRISWSNFIGDCNYMCRADVSWFKVLKVIYNYYSGVYNNRDDWKIAEGRILEKDDSGGSGGLHWVRMQGHSDWFEARTVIFINTDNSLIPWGWDKGYKDVIVGNTCRIYYDKVSDRCFEVIKILKHDRVPSKVYEDGLVISYK